jgi:hypothetical protein
MFIGSVSPTVHLDPVPVKIDRDVASAVISDKI